MVKIFILIILYFGQLYAINEKFTPIYSQRISYLGERVLSPDGQYIVSVVRSFDNYLIVHKKNTTTGYSIISSNIPINGTRNSISKLSISNNGGRLIALDSSSSKKIVIFQLNNLQTYDTPKQEKVYSFTPFEAEISSDEQYLIVVGQNGLGFIYMKNSNSLYDKIIDINIALLNLSLTTQSLNLTACTISRDKKTIAIGGNNPYVIIYNYDNNTQNFILQQKIHIQSDEIVFDLSLSQNGSYLLIGNNVSAKVYQRSTFSSSYSLFTTLLQCEDKYGVYSVKISLDAKFIFTSCYYYPTYIYSAQNNSYQNIQVINGKNIYGISISDNGLLIISDYQNSSFIIYKQECIPQTYPALNGSCIPCHSSCYTCNGSSISDCTSCFLYGFLTANRCIQCVAQQYLNSLGNCQNCDSSCLNCNGNNSNNCTSCSNSYYLLNGQCISCKQYISTCILCNATRCLCDSAKGQYLNKSCSSCNISCLSSSSNNSNNNANLNTSNNNSKTIIIICSIVAPLGLLTFIAIYCIIKRHICRQQIAHSQLDVQNISYDQINRKDQNQICSICLVGLVDIKTRCKHYFHRSCIQVWCTKSNKCPICRAIL